MGSSSSSSGSSSNSGPFQARSAMWLQLLILPLLATAAPSPTSSSSSSSGGSSLAELAASGAAGVVLGMAFAPQPDCRDVGIDANLCAVMYDEEKCLRSGAFKSLLPGEQGKLPILTRGLRRNDAESLIVRDRCKLELWDHAADLDLGVPADLVSPTLFITLFMLLVFLIILMVMARCSPGNYFLES